MADKDLILAQYQHEPTYNLDDMKFVLLCGPPSCGKDSAARYLVDNLVMDAIHQKFAEPLYLSVFADFNIPSWTPLDYFESVKNVPLAVFGGKSLRERLIEKSEVKMKPEFGKDIYGKFFVQNCQRHYDDNYEMIVVSDSGFKDEIEPLLQHVDPINILQFHIYAEKRGCTFAKDSRSYWQHPNIQCIKVTNDGDIDDYFDVVYNHVKDWLNKE